VRKRLEARSTNKWLEARGLKLEAREKSLKLEAISWKQKDAEAIR
jgi:hypothetical protein